MHRAGIVLGMVLGSAHAADMTVVRYLDQDPGDAAYATRILVTPDFLRMDSGEDGGDFVLLDRRKREVVNVMRDSRIAMVFATGPVPERPATWKPKLETHAGAEGTQRYRLTVNGIVCSEGVAAPQVAPGAARAVAEMKAVLAATQYRVWHDSPVELQHDCDLANQVWESGTTLKLGLPLQEREFNGRTRRFEGESKAPVRPDLFRVPSGFTAIAAPS